MWLVCKRKHDGLLFVQERTIREGFINYMIDIGEPVESIVLKTFDDLKEAEKYIKQLNYSDKIINNL